MLHSRIHNNRRNKWLVKLINDTCQLNKKDQKSGLPKTNNMRFIFNIFHIFVFKFFSLAQNQNSKVIVNFNAMV